MEHLTLTREQRKAEIVRDDKEARLDRGTIIDNDASVQEIRVSKNFLKLKSPFRMLVSGPSMSGKSR